MSSSDMTSSDLPLGFVGERLVAVIVNFKF